MLTLKQFITGILGNIATSLWYIPFLSNFLHYIRGVKLSRPFKVFIARGVIIDNRYPDKVFIESGVVLATRSMIIAHSFVPKNNKVISDREVIKKIYIGENVFIGASSIILPGTVIGKGCYVAAGSIVSGNFKSNCLIAGSPAIVKRRLINLD